MYDSLNARIRGRVLVPVREEFEEARQIWNSRLAKMPGAIVQCEASSDVALAVRFAREHKVTASVRSGGHSYAGLGVCEGGLMIDLSRMDQIRIDPEMRRARVGAGVKWGAFYEAAIRQGFGVTGGTVSSVGVAGFTLGGGSGWLSRKYGLGLDNLISVEVVSARGEVLQSSESENSELFWGIRGGAGNLGVVTRLDFCLHEVPSTVYGGQILYSFRDAGTVLKMFRDQMPKMPEEFVCFPCAFRVPRIPAFAEEIHGQVVLALMIGYIGDPERGKSVVAEFQSTAVPLEEAVGPMPYMNLQKSFDGGVPSGQRWYSRGQYLSGLSDEAIDTFLGFTEDLQGPLTLAYFGAEDGAVHRVNAGATAFPHRDAPYSFHILAGWMDPAEDEEVMSWTRAFHRAMTAYSTGGVYVNLLAEDEPGRVPAAYGNNFERLVRLKKRWDPDNLFRCNQNIPPA